MFSPSSNVIFSQDQCIISTCGGRCWNRSTTIWFMSYTKLVYFHTLKKLKNTPISNKWYNPPWHLVIIFILSMRHLRFALFIPYKENSIYILCILVTLASKLDNLTAEKCKNCENRPKIEICLLPWQRGYFSQIYPMCVSLRSRCIKYESIKQGFLGL